MRQFCPTREGKRCALETVDCARKQTRQGIRVSHKITIG